MDILAGSLPAERATREPAPIARREAIRAKARALGFDAVGFATARLDEGTKRDLDAYLAAGLHGEMDWLAAKASRRRDPKALWPEARSVIAVGLNYGPAGDPGEPTGRPERGAISVYARGDDYHDVVKKKLKTLAAWVAERYRAEVKVFVDTAPVMEKPLAMRAGVGWQGKHTNLVSRGNGSWLFLGELFTTLDLPPDAAETDHCGTCRRCLDACPTGAITAPYRIDARRCISYLTIEHKGPIPREFREPIGNRIYGCDDCLAVCPWNKYATRAREVAFHPRVELIAPRLADLASLDDAAFRALFRKSAVRRLGRDRFLRNVMIAVGNARDPALTAVAEARLADPSPLVRGAAVWALSRLLDEPSFAELRAANLPGETDPAVREEWERAEVDPPTRLAAFDYDLPEERIAARPVVPRDASRLLVVGGTLADHAFRDFPALLSPDDLLVLNDTRVIPARLHGRKEDAIAGARVEATIHREVAAGVWEAFARPAKRLAPDDRIHFGDGFCATVLDKGENGEVRLRFDREGDSLREALARFGRMPLPPYIKREEGPDLRDAADYQTAYAREEGAVAAPTAGLHFTDEMFRALESRGVERVFVTLHVGAGTFLPVRADDLRDHRMHGERGTISEEAAAAVNDTRRQGGRIVAVGTTSLRLLEAAADGAGFVRPFAGETDLFIRPGYRFRVVDRLLTNFHLPRSTLFVLVSAFAGMRRMRRAYAHAIAAGYRFYSYGDACLIDRAGPR